MSSKIQIYLYTNLITNKPCYVGQTKNSLKIRAGHDGVNYRKCTKFFSLEIEKYNWENFKGEILVEVEDKKYANLLEWFYTIEFNTLWPNGCNDSCGTSLSEGNKKQHSKIMKKYCQSENIRYERSERAKGNQNAKGYRFTDEQRQKQSEKLKDYFRNHEAPTKGRKQTEEEKIKRSNAIKKLKWFTNGITNVRKVECPEGFWLGQTRLPKNKVQNDSC